MTPDYDRAATKATETLIQYHITATPVEPLPILKKIPGVLVVSFAEMALQVGEDRKAVISSFGDSQDAVTSIKDIDGKLRYIVAYNQRLPFYMLQRALARELAHIVLHHDGSRTKEARMEESMCFARHLISPRPIIKAIQDAGITLTVEKFGCISGCYERCLIGLRKTPGCHVPPELNRALREQFSDYITNFVDFMNLLPNDDMSAIADFGSFMDGYEE